MKKIRKYLKKLDSFTAKHPYLVLGIILVLPGLMLSIPLPFLKLSHLGYGTMYLSGYFLLFF